MAFDIILLTIIIVLLGYASIELFAVKQYLDGLMKRIRKISKTLRKLSNDLNKK